MASALITYCRPAPVHLTPGCCCFPVVSPPRVPQEKALLSVFTTNYSEGIELISPNFGEVRGQIVHVTRGVVTVVQRAVWALRLRLKRTETSRGGLDVDDDK